MKRPGILAEKRRHELVAALLAPVLTVLIFATNKHPIQPLVVLAWIVNVGYLFVLAFRNVRWKSVSANPKTRPK